VVEDLLAAPSWQEYRATPSKVLFLDSRTREKGFDVTLYCAETRELARATTLVTIETRILRMFVLVVCERCWCGM